jgi:hypothetical protein
LGAHYGTDFIDLGENLEHLTREFSKMQVARSTSKARPMHNIENNNKLTGVYTSVYNSNVVNERVIPENPRVASRNTLDSVKKGMFETNLHNQDRSVAQVRRKPELIRGMPGKRSNVLYSSKKDLPSDKLNAEAKKKAYKIIKKAIELSGITPERAKYICDIARYEGGIGNLTPKQKSDNGITKNDEKFSAHVQHLAKINGFTSPVNETVGARLSRIYGLIVSDNEQERNPFLRLSCPPFKK